MVWLCLCLLTLFAAFAGPANADCRTGRLVQICPPEPAAAESPAAQPPADPTAEPAPPARKVLRVPQRPPGFAVGNLFPTTEHSILLNPARYGLPPAENGWRYYAVEGFIYRVATDTDLVLSAERTSDPALQR